MARSSPAQGKAGRVIGAIPRAAWLALAGLLLVGVVLIADLSLTWFRYGPRIAALADSVPDMTSFMKRRAEEGVPPRAHRWVPLDSLPGPLVCTLLAAENVRFFEHGALDWENQRAMFFRVLRGDLSRGGSGIPQQLARNLFLEPDRTIRRKLREYLLAYKISHMLSKERQLELYINLIEWGEGVWGISSGSEQVFQRPVEQLTPSEAVLLVNVLPSPHRGLDFATSAPRRAKAALVAGILWREAILNEVEWGATVARLRRIGDYVDLGMTPAEAARAVTEEMGEERVLDPHRADRAPPRVLCDRVRRGVP